MIELFMEQTLYSRSEILAWNPTTHLVLTSNGGLYRVDERSIEHIKGPSPDPEERIDDDG